MIILSSGSLYSYGLNRFFKLAKKAGFSDVEIMITDVWDTREIDYLNGLSKEFGIKIVSFHAPFFNVKIWPNPEQKLLGSLKLAEKMKAKTLVAHYYEPHNPTVLKIQKKTKVKIAVENMPKHRGEERSYKYDGFNPKDLEDFDFLCLDTNHLATTGLDLLSVYQKIKQKIVHIHLSDALKLRTLKKEEEDEHLLPGEGKLPLALFLKQLKKDKYKGIISLELKPGVLGEGDENEIVKRLKKARNFVERFYQ